VDLPLNSRKVGSQFTSITQEQHPKHGFVKVANPQDLLVSFSLWMQRHRSLSTLIAQLAKRSEFVMHDAMCDGE
jgi:hypothetical protein